MNGDAVITGRLTAQEFHTEFVSASIIFESGSTLFGNTPDDLHTFTGSILITGSISYPEYIDLDTTPAQSVSSTTEGRLSWDNGTRDLIVGAGNNVDIHLGQSEWSYVYNAEATTLTKGEVVYISGSQGNTIAVKRAQDTGDDLSAGTLGLVGESIASGDEGLVIVSGLLRKLNTSTLTAGKLLFLGSTPGTYTQTSPTAPSHSVRIGYVAKVSPTQGEIYVKIDNGYEIGELHDIVDNTTTSSYGDLLVKNGSVWKNSKQLTGSYGITGSLQATSFTGSLQGTASYATYAVSTKGGAVAAGAFSGLPLKGTVNFGSAYPNTNYAISIVGGDARTWTIESKAIGGFVINSNSNVALDNEVYWITTPYNS